MYIKLGDSTAKVVGVSSSDIATTFAIKGQDGISTVLDNIGTEITCVLRETARSA